MKLLRQMLLVLAICFAGEMVHKLLRIPIPGSVMGMLILFICLCTGVIKVEMLAEITEFLMNYLAFFFIPAGVSLVAYLDILNANITAIFGISLITTVLVLTVTGHTVQLFKGGRKS